MKDKIIIDKLIDYISDIEEYVNDADYNIFKNDKKTLSACAFSVSQIGELVGDLSDDTLNKFSNIPWKSIKGMRNKIVHDYDNVDLSILWNTIVNDLPSLKIELIKIMNKI